MKSLLRTALQSLLFVGVGAGIMLLVYQHENTAYLVECAQEKISPDQCSLLAKLVNDFAHVRFGWIALVLLAYLASVVSRALKWRLLLQPLCARPRLAVALLSILIGYFANLGLPRVGELVRAALISRHEGIPVERVMGSIVADRAVDLLCLAIVLGFASLLEFDKIGGFVSSRGSLPTDAASWAAVGVVLLAVVGTLLFFRQRLGATRLFQGASARLRGFREGLRTVGRLRHPAWFIVHNVNVWLLSYLMTWMGLQAFAPTAHLDLRAALIVFVFATLGIVIPAPGGMGTFHFLVISALTLFYGVRGDDAFSSANIFFFSVNIGFTILLGLASLVALPLLDERRPEYS